MTMLSEVRTALGNVLGGATVLRRAAGRGRLFELFVVTGIATRLQNYGFDVWLQRSDGSRIYPTDTDRRFIQRGGAPSGVPSAAQGSGNASVIGFRTATGSRWEIWNGVQFQGRSGATHEVDVALVPAEVGDALRVGGGVPFGRPRVAIECKCQRRPKIRQFRRLKIRQIDEGTSLRSSPPPDAIGADGWCRVRRPDCHAGSATARCAAACGSCCRES